jgi:hypothetical protein
MSVSVNCTPLVTTVDSIRYDSMRSEKWINTHLCLLLGNFKWSDEYFDEKLLLNCHYCEL